MRILPLATTVTLILSVPTFTSSFARPCPEYVRPFASFAASRLSLEGFPNAHNPSLIRTDFGIILTFRISPGLNSGEISRMGAVLLNDNLEVISTPQLLDSRLTGTSPHQSEDARIFSLNGKVYLIYNDNIDETAVTLDRRRDMFIAELNYVHDEFVLGPATKLIPPPQHLHQKWQKNWVPFIYENTLLLGYTLAPQEILLPDLATGECRTFCKTSSNIHWPWGILRGGTPAQLVDGQYLSFFHSFALTRSMASVANAKAHYYMGAYTFSSTPPFEITAVSREPFVDADFYTRSGLDKVVFFPGGYLDRGTFLLLAYGKDDKEIWIGRIDKTFLKESLVAVEHKMQPAGSQN